MTRVTLRCNVFLTFSWTSNLKHLLLRAFLEDVLLEMLSKVGVLAERSMKKKKTSSDSSGGTGRLWRSGSALVEIFDVMFCAPLAQNLSKVSQMHPENMQEYLFRFSVLF